MRKLIWNAALILAVVFISANVNAQSFEGKMTMKIEYEEVPEEYEPYLSMFPKESQLYVKGKKTRIEQNTMGGTNITIMDSETGKGYMVMNAMGQKAAYELDNANAKEEAAEKPVVTYIDETKEIAGYKCKKAELKYEGEEEPMVIWYTEEITDVYNQQYNGLGIKGAVMEYSVSANGMVMTMSVSEIKKEKVSDDKFTVPEGYEIKPYSELMKLGQGG
jgi:GLPGLI family protein